MERYSALYALLLISFPLYADSHTCDEVRLADIGWTDVSATTALAAELLKALKYEPEILVLSLPVALASLKNKDVDVFLGNWMPAQEADVRPYLSDKTILRLQKNLKDARYTLAVPRYVYEAGVRSFKDLKDHVKEFAAKIYGIEPGNDGNRKIIDMIGSNAFNLKGWELVESSEQGMLLEVKAAIKQKKWIVFLGWAPHPMNVALDMEYLKGGDDFFGKNFGQAHVYTLARRELADDCPNLARFFHNLTFTSSMENALMALILEEHQSPQKAAQNWLIKNQHQARSWLFGVKDIAGQDGGAALTAYLEMLEHKKASKKMLQIPLGRWMEQVIAAITTHGARPLRAFSEKIEKTLNGLSDFIIEIPWALLVSILSLLSYACRRSISLSLMVFFGLLLIVNLELWPETLQTLVLVLVSSIIALSLGVPLGIAASRWPRFYSVLRPILDLLQTIPTFVYLIPTLMLFGLGLVPGLISTIIFAISAPIRLTYLGLSSVPKELLEASSAFGATTLQRLTKVELPHARSFIMAGFTQCIMLSLSMVVIAALVGVEGLGTPVIRSLNTVNIALGFEAGIAIVILAILLDRTLNFDQPKSR